MPLSVTPTRMGYQILGGGGEVGHREVMSPVELSIQRQQKAESTPITKQRQEKAETNDKIDVGARLVCPISIVHLGKDE